MHRGLHRWTALLTALIWILGLTAYGESVPAGTVTDSAITDDGQVRVYLKSLGDLSGMQLTLSGEYRLGESMRFDRGTRLAFAAANGEIYLAAEGFVMKAGTEAVLTRCAGEDGGENGLYIYESEKDTLYEGDLRILCDGDVLRCVLTISMEDYLRGVVAYEMSDSFPLEALKAQAVAARTYAMSKKAARADAEYDVTDTTSDQVYKGADGEYVNVAQAVEETRGVVGTYQGSYAGCYYTASNGGQVATPNQIWGGDGDYGYIQQKDDPYDLENSRSMVNSLSVPAARDEGDFWKLLDERIDTSGHARVRGGEITEITLSDPAFEGSYMYRQMDVTMKIQTRDRGLVEVEYDGDRISGWAMGYAYLEGKWYKWDLLPWQDTEETRTVSLSVYEDVKDGFSLGLNSRDYEICSVRQEGENYLIEMRRFGHGVGMSQRGAQVMAGNYDMSYVEILNFYYPGMTLERIDWDTPELPAQEEIPQALAKEMLNLPPAEGDLGTLAEGEYYARVVLQGKTLLNVRTGPSTEYPAVARLYDGYRLVVCAQENGWAQVRAAAFTGYVKMDYIQAESE
ncbi:MAG: SpoIID/LytB domain-containing protein [Clostridiales bacterium]|nr:SpoIID/LytB domain-containing protein [Clostridiales bacterium]